MQDSEEHQYDIKEDDCNTSSKKVIQDPMQHVGEPGRSQIVDEQLKLKEVRTNKYLLILRH